MPAGSHNRQYSWTMEKNAATEIILNVKTAGQYHYNIYQTTEKKEDYKYDQSRYYVTVEAYCNESNQLKVVTIVANEKGEKIEAISFKNSYMGEEKPNTTQPSNPSQPSRPSHSDKVQKINSVKTGDDSPVMGYFLLLFGSLICLSILTYESQRRNKGESLDEAYMEKILENHLFLDFDFFYMWFIIKCNRSIWCRCGNGKGITGDSGLYQ